MAVCLFKLHYCIYRINESPECHWKHVSICSQYSESTINSE